MPSISGVRLWWPYLRAIERPLELGDRVRVYATHTPHGAYLEGTLAENPFAVEQPERWPEGAFSLRFDDQLFGIITDDGENHGCHDSGEWYRIERIA
jgi:hypothetical protein